MEKLILEHDWCTLFQFSKFLFLLFKFSFNSNSHSWNVLEVTVNSSEWQNFTLDWTIPWLYVLFLSWNTNNYKSPRNFCRINKSQIHQVPLKYLTDTNRPHKTLSFLTRRVTQRVSGEEGNLPAWAHYCCCTSRVAAIASVLEHF